MTFAEEIMLPFLQIIQHPDEITPRSERKKVETRGSWCKVEWPPNTTPTGVGGYWVGLVFLVNGVLGRLKVQRAF